MCYTVPKYLVTYNGMIVDSFYNSADMDEFSKSNIDGNYRIYCLGTDFLKDGHTEGYLNSQKKNRSE